MRLNILLCVILYTGSVSGSVIRDVEPQIVANVKSELVYLQLDQYIESLLISESGESVNVVLKKDINLLTIIRARSDFEKDMFNSSWGHKGCFRSYREKISPSLQIIFFKDLQGRISIQMDVDENAPSLGSPLRTLKHVRALTLHKFGRFFGKPMQSNQFAIARKLKDKQSKLNRISKN